MNWKILILVTLLGILLGITSVGAEYTQSNNVIYIDDLTMEIGEEKQIPLKLLNSTGVGGLQVTIYFDESVINITNVTSGDFNKFTPDFSNISDGILRITCMKQGVDLTGDLVIAHLRIKALSEGTSPLKFTADLYTRNGRRVNESTRNGSVIVLSPISNITIHVRLYETSKNNNIINTAIEVSNIPEGVHLKKYCMSIKLKNLEVMNIVPTMGTCNHQISGDTLIITGDISPNRSGKFSIVNITFKINDDYSAIIDKAELSDINGYVFKKVLLESEVIRTIDNIKIVDEKVKNNIKTKKLIEMEDMKIGELEISNLNDTLITPIPDESIDIAINENVIKNLTNVLEVAKDIKKEVIREESDVEKVVEKIAENIKPILSQNFNIKDITKKQPERVKNEVISTISFKAESTKKGFVIVRIPIGTLTVKNITVYDKDTMVVLKKDDIGSKIGWYRIPTDGILEITLVKDPVVNITLSAEISDSEKSDEANRGSDNRGSEDSETSHTSTETDSPSINKIVAKDIKSKKIIRFIYEAKLITGSEIDINLSAKYLKTDINLITTPLEINENCILVGGPVANPVVKKYLNYFPVKVTNKYPGKHRGVIEVIKINGHTVVLLAGSDRWGTKAAVEYFKTLEDLPEEFIFVEWRDKKAIKIERP